MRRQRRVTTRGVTVRYRTVTAQASWKASFAVSRRCGNAVDRNRLRRRLREAVHMNNQRIPNTSQLLISADRYWLHAPFDDLVSTIGSAIDKATGAIK